MYVAMIAGNYQIIMVVVGSLARRSASLAGVIPLLPTIRAVLLISSLVSFENDAS